MTIYGYKIVDGKAEVDFKAATNIRHMFSLYLKGFPIIDAAKDAGVERTSSHCGKYLSDRRYLGDDFYPRIIDEDTFNKVQAERKRRNRRPPGLSSYKYYPVATKDLFRLKITPVDLERISELKGAERAAYLYSRIDGEISEYCTDLYEKVMSEETEKMIAKLVLPDETSEVA